MKTLGELIQERRQKDCLSRFRIARMSNVSEATIFCIEQTGKGKTALNIAKICNFLGVDPEPYLPWDFCEDERRRKFPTLILIAQAKKGLTNQEVAQLIGVSPMTISMYHSGRTQPESVRLIENLSNVLDIELEALKAAWCWKKLDHSSREMEDGLYCSRCHYVKDKSEFDHYGAGYFSTCKQCRRETREKKQQLKRSQTEEKTAAERSLERAVRKVLQS